MRPIRSITSTFAGVLLAGVVALPAAARSPMPSGPSSASLPAPFTLSIVFGPGVREGSTQVDGSLTTTRGYGNSPLLVQTSDPRFDGRVTIAFDTNEYRSSDGASFTYGTATWRIVTADGAWQGTYPIVITDEFTSVVTVALAGEGSYEGMTAVWEQPLDGDRWDIRGVIFPTTPLEPPVAAP